ncbi:MAG: hypothetical protein AAGB24_00710 [Bacteroidota bacterium]
MELQRPYQAVIFTNTGTVGGHGYAQRGIEMEHLARKQPGFPDFESEHDGWGITIRYYCRR